MIIDDIAATLKLTKSVLNTTLGTVLGLFSVGSVVMFFVSFGAVTVSLFFGLDSLFSFFVDEINIDHSSDWFELVSYCLNFKFVKRLLGFFYYTTLAFSSACAAFYATVVVLSVMPSILRWWHSFINLITGD